MDHQHNNSRLKKKVLKGNERGQKYDYEQKIHMSLCAEDRAGMWLHSHSEWE